VSVKNRSGTLPFVKKKNQIAPRSRIQPGALEGRDPARSMEGKKSTGHGKGTRRLNKSDRVA